MNARIPIVVVLAGPNGAGKATASEALLRDELAISDFVNADVIAHGLSGFAPEKAAFAAGRILLSRLDDLAAHRAEFAFETTLASRTFAPWLSQRIVEGYEFQLMFVWLPGTEMAITRVAARVRTGGHDIPADSIRRRYARGIRNLLELYMPIATRWTIVHGATPVPTPIASGGAGRPTEVQDPSGWEALWDQSGIREREPDRQGFIRNENAIVSAFQRGARDAILRHKALGESIVIWRDGRVVEVPPEQIDAELERAERAAGLR